MKKSFKKLFASLLVAIMVFSVTPIGALTEIDLASLFTVEASALTSGNYTYTVSGSNATITAYNGTASTLTIPSTLGGYTVTAIEYGVFDGDTNLVNVTIPGTITRIGYGKIYTGAFQNCKNLRKVTFEKGSADASINGHTFKGCTSLQEVTIPGNYITIGVDAFRDCTSLKSVTLEKSKYSYANQSIGNAAFYDCSSLTNISLPTTLNAIGSSAFHGCAIEEIAIPEGVTVIDYGAFEACGNLTKITLPSTLTRISYGRTYEGAFKNCGNLRTVIFKEGSNDLSIEANTFDRCSNLETVHLPLNLVSIGEGAFDGTPSSLVICSKSYSSYGKTYADSNSIAFKLCNGSHTTAPTPSYKEENVSMNYKDSMHFNGVVSIETSNSGVASVSDDKITATGTGSADVTVTFSDGNVCVYHVNVSYTWWQWIIVIVLFGWIWY